MEYQRGSQRDCHPVREDQEPLLDIEELQPCPPIWHVAGAAHASWYADKNRLARTERKASDRPSLTRPRAVLGQVNRPASGRQRPWGGAGLLWARDGDRLDRDRQRTGIWDAPGNGEGAALAYSPNST